MIRAIKTDQDFYPEWSPFRSHVALDIRYMTNDCNFRCYVSVLGVSMTSIIVFEFFLLLYGILVNMSVYILDFKLSFDHGLQLVNDVSVLNGVLAHFMAIFSFFCVFFASISLLFWHFRGMFNTIFVFPFQFTGQF